VPASPAVVAVVESLVYPGGTIQIPLRFADFVDITAESVTLDGQPLFAEQTQEALQDGFINAEFDLFLIDGSSLFRDEYTDILDGESAANIPAILESDSIFRQ
jgi:hypothetical protein